VISTELSIGDLADAAGVSRRTVRFYVQQRLLPVPLGRGRGRHYDQSHLQRLRRINELQSAGHSLDAIRRILERGESAAPPAPPAPAASPRRAPRPALSAELWTRLRLGEGVELHYDTTRHRPTVEQLMQLREAVRAALRPNPDTDAEHGHSDDGTR
jgi:DNA-binding transcriptional MerR regulator